MDFWESLISDGFLGILDFLMDWASESLIFDGFGVEIFDF
jgi:hypothetical protein